jgi:hypothetical protein
MITPEQLARSGTEHGEQSALFCWASMNLHLYPQLKWLHSSANGIFTDSGHKAKEKAAGMKNGISDICLPVSKWTLPGIIAPRLLHCGLYLEMKTRDKKRPNDPLAGATKEQKEFGEFVQGQGYTFYVVYGWEDARDRILEYLR